MVLYIVYSPQVTTLFHETGHGLQHMLTTVPHAPAAGISGVEWDAVELPSQVVHYIVHYIAHYSALQSASHSALHRALQCVT